MLDLPPLDTLTQAAAVDTLNDVTVRLIAGELSDDEMREAMDWVQRYIAQVEAEDLARPHVVYLREPLSRLCRAIGPFPGPAEALAEAARFRSWPVETDVVPMFAPGVQP